MLVVEADRAKLITQLNKNKIYGQKQGPMFSKQSQSVINLQSKGSLKVTKPESRGGLQQANSIEEI